MFYGLNKFFYKSKASTLLFNLFFLSMSLLLVEGINSGMGVINWSLPNEPEAFTYDDIMCDETPNIQASIVCTGYYPILCNC